MDGCRSIHAKVRDHTALHEIHQQRADSGFYYVAAEHYDNSLFRFGRRYDRIHDESEIAGDEDVGQGADERVECAVGTRRRRKFLSGHLVGTAADWNSFYAGKISLAAVAGGWLYFVVWGGM
jgi:hypothetical protein